jgi:multisubunit Na+/H+ antiporter MnhG subunit
LYLQHNPFILPPELLPFTAHPVLSLIPLENILPHGAGFIQILSVCSFQGQTQYDKCLYHAQDHDDVAPAAANLTTHVDKHVFSTSIASATTALRDSSNSNGLLLNTFMGSSKCEYSMHSSSTVYSLPSTNGACLPMQPVVDPTVNLTSYYNLTGYSESLNLSALCDDESCKNCLVQSLGGLSASCNGIESETSSFALGEVCKGSGSVSGGYVIAIFNPLFSGAATCDVSVADGDADRVVSYDTLGPADGYCRSGASGLFSSVAMSRSGNVDVRFNCEFSNCSSCEIELTDIAPDQCTILNPQPFQTVAVKVWSLADIATCDASKLSIEILIVIILVSVFGFIAGIAVIRISYTRQHLLKIAFLSFLSALVGSAVHLRESIRSRNAASRLKLFLTLVIASASGWLLQRVTDTIVWCKNSLGWRLSHEKPLFGDLIQFVMVILCGAICKWWSEAWMVRNRVFFESIHFVSLT